MLVTKFAVNNTSTVNHLNNTIGQSIIEQKLSDDEFNKYFFQSKEYNLNREMITRITFHVHRNEKHRIGTDVSWIRKQKKHFHDAKVITMEKAVKVNTIYDTRILRNKTKFSSGFKHLFEGCELLAEKHIMLFNLKPDNIMLKTGGRFRKYNKIY